MFENICGIQLQGGYFDSDTNLKFFSKEIQRISLIYGRNGSGKTSVAKAFYEYSKDKENYSTINMCDIDNNIIPDTSIEKEKIYIFNEDFIQKNIKFDGNELDTVVMLGDQVTIDNELIELEDKMKVVSDYYGEIVEKEREIKKSELDISPDYWMNQMLENFRKGWAERERKIKNLRANSPVNEQKILEIMRECETLSTEELREQYNKKMAELKRAGEVNRVPVPIPNITYYSSRINDIKDKLEAKISEPILSLKEQSIFEIIQREGVQIIEKSNNVFAKTETTICPFCFQEVDELYKHSLLEAIEHVLDTEDANIHKGELEALKVEEIVTDYNLYHEVDLKLVNDLHELIKQYNLGVKRNIDLIRMKKNNVYQPIIDEIDNLEERVIGINNLINRLNDKSVEYNGLTEKIDAKKENLIQLNKRIARSENAEYFKQYNEKERLKMDIEIERSATFLKKNELESNIKNLNDQKLQIDIAKDLINRYLSYILFNDNRLCIEIEKGKYIVKSRGERIQLKNLSVGERNIIGLCYFFSKIFKGQSYSSAYQNEMLVVLDDPISSFDFENKVGIYSFLRSQLNKIISGNGNSKIVIFSHEIEVIYNLEKVCDDIGLKKKKYIVCKLSNKALIEQEHTISNEYTNLLNQIYLFAVEEEESQYLESSIGNTMRKVLEAFGTFLYKIGISGLSINEDVLALIEDTKQREYFENSMYRLVLNGDSHLEERTKGMSQKSFFDFISVEEKRNTAKEILVFLYLINPLHIERHLVNNTNSTNNRIENIENWRDEILLY